MLGEEITKLAEVDQRSIRVIADTAFRKRGVVDKRLVVLPEKRQIW